MNTRFRMALCAAGAIMAATLTAGVSAERKVGSKQGQDRVTVIEKKTSNARDAGTVGVNAEFGNAPRVTLSFPSTVAGGFETRGKMTFRESDDRVISVFLTVFFHDGDVATVTLYDTRDGDPPASSGTITFGITAAAYQPDLGSNGTAIVTVTDETLNFTQMSTSFVVR